MQNPYIHWIWFQMVSTNIQAKPCKNPSKNHLCIHQPSLFQPTSGTSSRQPPSYRLPSVNWQATNLHGTWCDYGFEIKTTLWHKDQKKEVSSTSLSVVVLEGIYWFHGWLVVVYCPAKSSSKSSKILLDQSCPTKKHPAIRPKNRPEAPSKRHSPRGCCLWTGLGIEYLAIS